MKKTILDGTHIRIRVKRRLVAYKGRLKALVFESDFRFIFSKFIKKYKLEYPDTSDIDSHFKVFENIIEIASTEDLWQINYNFDNYQMDKD